MDRQGTIEAIFGSPRALIGMLHVGALPGTPRSSQSVSELSERVVDEARLYREAGFHGLMLENMHDRPYLKRGVGPEIVAAMAAVAREIRSEVELPLGVQVLAGADREAIAVAAATGAAFARVEGLVFAHVADEGLIESDAGELLRYRRAIGAEEVRIFADVKKKHSSHAVTADVDLVETARAAQFFLADGVIVTGTETGRPAAPEEAAEVGAAVEVPTLIGSGVTAANLADYPAADAFIVGSSVKQGGVWSEPLDPTRLEALVARFHEIAAG
jgi:membrane complex biogenesis BtpA family protein